MPHRYVDGPVFEPDSIDEGAERDVLIRLAGKSGPNPPPGFGHRTSTLFHAELAEREFGSALLAVADLMAWVAEKHLHLRTEPPVETFEFVQMEALLAAIERGVTSDVTPAQALELVACNAELSRHRAAGNPTTSRWLLGAEAHRQWRVQLHHAVTQGDLRPLDFASKLPLARQDTAPSQQATASPNYAMLATPDQLIEAFGGMSGMNAGWFRSMKDRPALDEAVVVRGVKGRKGAPPLLDVYRVMRYLVDPKRKVRTMRAETGWRLLKAHFPKVYEVHHAYDPNAGD